ncbi:MAG: amidohydrolase family protein [Microthrixaceae bacterium]|nr:amidohydrolase family protein [Microthrixaceae bacterium]
MGETTGGDRRLVLVGGTLIDGAGGPPQPNTDVVLVGDLIESVMPTDAREPDRQPDDADAMVVDCSGLTIMPGLIDAHCHITFGEPQSNDELFFHRPQTTSALLASFNVRKLLLAGVTGFLDADCLYDIGPALRDGIEAGLVEGPRMSAGMNALLTAAGGTAGRLIPDSGRLGYGHVVRDRDEMVRVTREQIKYGADWVKIHVTGLVPGVSGEVSVWTADELKAVVDTAHDLGTPAVAHCRSAESTRMAAGAGVDLILHGSFMDDAALEAVVESGAALCPTFTFLSNLCDHGHLVGAATAQVDLFRGEISATAAQIRQAHEAGVKVLCGSESGFALTPYGHWHSRELEVFVEEVGLSPMEAIGCATNNGAFALRLEGEVGLVQPGMLADVLVVDGDPSVDVSVLGDRANLREVVSRGRRVDLSGPWPERRTLPGEKVGLWAAESLTRDVVNA